MAARCTHTAHVPRGLSRWYASIFHNCLQHVLESILEAVIAGSSQYAALMGHDELQ